MRRFNALPAVPSSYALLKVLSPSEIGMAWAAGYVVDTSDPAAPVCRQGLDNYDDPLASDSIADWRTRMYLLWFCYFYENLMKINKPFDAIEELIVEFKNLSMLNVGKLRIESLYAGTSGVDPVTDAERKRQIEYLEPHYLAALDALGRYSHADDGNLSA